ncbi:MAG: hydantoinase/oxoprolinase family protein [Nitrososphaeria archaeon]|nr:hydantoinase/oxoprolinase family protein [Nitrososphaeria archaeon]NIN52357.1 hydantoinase/oxoprolinase family protein [Nitrososphaeria archaeon]NIQ32835.1 hydantoinase/oxoprolinase family protein [Nitrososphaeria archaeon]
MARYRLGVDVGGTFTDSVLMNEETGEIKIAKVASTPRNPSIGFIDAVRQVLKTMEMSPQEVRLLVHATTVATNAIIEGKVARAGFITTKGFRDILEIQRQIKPKLYDLFHDKPRPLVPRNRCLEVMERMSPEGEVLTPLEEVEVKGVVDALKKEEVESIAVCLLHSYLNPDHERRVGEIVTQEFPETFLSLSYEVCPEFREYFRASTTVVNACIIPIVATYVEELERQLASIGMRREFYIMQSSGGIVTADEAKRKPVYVVESGPAAGVIAGQFIGGLVGSDNVITLDMGGTTAKVGLVELGRIKMAVDYEIGYVARAESSFTKGGGYPIRTSVIDLAEIGSGGGSIAWIDAGGALKVGPQSAGADPGPVCYGKGGVDPTITDANLVLGRLSPDYFLGGEMKLDVEAARRAIKEKVADRLGMDVVTAANGIVEIANANMVRAMRFISVDRGYDPRDFTFIAFGGAGPMHANSIAREIDISSLVIPPSPGVTSALGLLVTDLKHDYMLTRVQRLQALDLEAVNKIYGEYESEAAKLLAQEGVSKEDVTFTRFMDMRYVGQSYELKVPIPSADLKESDIDPINEKFNIEHERVYGHCDRSEPVEVVNLRLEATGIIAKPKLRELPPGERSPEKALKHRRKVFFDEASGYIECPVYDRYRLGRGTVLEGPAVVEEMDSTVLIHPNYVAEVDRYGNILIKRV